MIHRTFKNKSDFRNRYLIDNNENAKIKACRFIKKLECEKNNYLRKVKSDRIIKTEKKKKKNKENNIFLKEEKEFNTIQKKFQVLERLKKRGNFELNNKKLVNNAKFFLKNIGKHQDSKINQEKDSKINISENLLIESSNSLFKQNLSRKTSLNILTNEQFFNSENEEFLDKMKTHRRDQFIKNGRSYSIEVKSKISKIPKISLNQLSKFKPLLSFAIKANKIIE